MLMYQIDTLTATADTPFISVLEVWAGTRQSTETVSERVPTQTANEQRGSQDEARTKQENTKKKGGYFFQGLQESLQHSNTGVFRRVLCEGYKLYSLCLYDATESHREPLQRILKAILYKPLHTLEIPKSKLILDCIKIEQMFKISRGRLYSLVGSIGDRLNRNSTKQVPMKEPLYSLHNSGHQQAFTIYSKSVKISQK